MFGVRRTFSNLLCAHDFYKAIQPLLFFTHLLGVTSYVVVTNKRGVKSLAFSRLSYVISIVIVACFLYSSHFVVFYRETYIEPFTATGVINSGEKVIVLTNCAGAFIVLINNFLYRRQLLWVIESFPKIDKTFERIGIHWKYTNVLLIVICLLAFTNFVLLSILLVFILIWECGFHYYPPLPEMFVTLHVPICIHYAVLVFTFLMLSTEVRMHALNKVS